MLDNACSTLTKTLNRLRSTCGCTVLTALLSTLCVAHATSEDLINHPASATKTATQATAQTKAHALIDQMEALYRGKTSRARILMKINTPQYQREMSLATSSRGVDDFFIRILSPRRDAGITTLKLDNEMWNYFPKIDKIIKVPPSMMMGSWMGSDFTNDDLVKETTLSQDYHLSLVETPTQYVITLLPRTQTVTIWGKIEYVIDRQHLVPITQNFFDDRGELVRKLNFSHLKNYDGHLRPSQLEMKALNKPGHSTQVIYESLEFNPDDLSTDMFTLRNLRRRQ
ncbi:MAG: hypothetical protein ACI9SB_002186 [Candidatus Azotimanducaceae bacterium]|jgi:hypothetical protein